MTERIPELAALAAVDEEEATHLSRWFYESTPELHRGLGELFVADARFAASWDRRAAGVAAFVSEAITAGEA